MNVGRYTGDFLITGICTDWGKIFRVAIGCKDSFVIYNGTRYETPDDYRELYRVINNERIEKMLDAV